MLTSEGGLRRSSGTEVLRRVLGNRYRTGSKEYGTHKDLLNSIWRMLDGRNCTRFRDVRTDEVLRLMREIYSSGLGPYIDSIASRSDTLTGSPPRIFNGRGLYIRNQGEHSIAGVKIQLASNRNRMISAETVHFKVFENRVVVIVEVIEGSIGTVGLGHEVGEETVTGGGLMIDGLSWLMGVDEGQAFELVPG
ncbi:hypothetical protein BDD12DRAFT_898374 [Trichophaea hybrida]|nr:hypothetical protein BDD12DRAFT_898374 [Trichophaea hybrida]